MVRVWFRVSIMVSLTVMLTTQVPVEGKSSVCLICMKYTVE